MHLSHVTAPGGLQCHQILKPQPALACYHHSRSRSRCQCHESFGHPRFRTISAERQVSARQNIVQRVQHRFVETSLEHATRTCLAAAAVTLALACTAVQPAEAFSKSGLSKALASAVRPKPTDPEDQKSKRTTEFAHAPEVCHEETTLSKASTAAVSEMRMRAALFDEATHKTQALRKRTSQFVDSMWQSLE